jgi:large subunit ribosomal protein L11
MKVKLIVDGANMKPGPTVSQQLGPMGINLGKVIEDVNKETSGFKGMKVPVELDIDPSTKEFTITVSSPPVSELIKKELKAEKGSADAGKTKIGNLAIEQIISISKTKMPDMLARDLQAAVKLTIGSCVSLGVLVENKEAKEVIPEVNSGVYDQEISQEKTDVSEEKKAELDASFSGVKAEQEAAAKALEEEKAAEEAKKLEAVTEEKPEEKKDETKAKEEEKKK